jgi:tetratricopeptide (TPR) repeat protein
MGLNDFDKALKAYSRAIGSRGCQPIALFKRAFLYFRLNKVNEALLDVTSYLDEKPDDGQALLLKGDILSEAGDYKEAIIVYEQVIKFDATDKLAPIALSSIAKIKIELKDFYGAFFAFSREPDAKKFSKAQNMLRLYNDSVLDLMKRKFKSGVHKLTKIIKGKEASI